MCWCTLRVSSCAAGAHFTADAGLLNPIGPELLVPPEGVVQDRVWALEVRGTVPPREGAASTLTSNEGSSVPPIQQYDSSGSLPMPRSIAIAMPAYHACCLYLSFGSEQRLGLVAP